MYSCGNHSFATETWRSRSFATTGSTSWRSCAVVRRPGASVTVLTVPERGSGRLVPAVSAAEQPPDRALGAGGRLLLARGVAGDDHRCPRRPRAEVAHRLATLGEWVGPLCHGAQLSGGDELEQVGEVVGIVLRDEELQPLAEHARTHHEGDDPSEDPDPAAVLRGADLDEDAVRLEDAPQR